MTRFEDSATTVVNTYSVSISEETLRPCLRNALLLSTVVKVVLGLTVNLAI